MKILVILYLMFFLVICEVSGQQLRISKDQTTISRHSMGTRLYYTKVREFEIPIYKIVDPHLFGLIRAIVEVTDSTLMTYLERNDLSYEIYMYLWEENGDTRIHIELDIPEKILCKYWYYLLTIDIDEPEILKGVVFYNHVPITIDYSNSFNERMLLQKTTSSVIYSGYKRSTGGFFDELISFDGPPELLYMLLEYKDGMFYVYLAFGYIANPFYEFVQKNEALKKMIYFLEEWSIEERSGGKVNILPEELKEFRNYKCW